MRSPRSHCWERGRFHYFARLGAIAVSSGLAMHMESLPELTQRDYVSL